ncbi:MAG: tetratricopeptide repeat protein [Isosphaerales bacterium]
MAEHERCPKCGMALPPHTPHGLCPICVYREVMDESGLESEVTFPPSRRADLTLSLEPASSSVLGRIAETAGEVPHVLLRDSELATGPGPILIPSSSEMPGPAGRPDRYQLFGEIARGGMGAILRGRDVDLGRDLALKVLLESHKDKPELIRRFVEEAQISGQLQHPGVVPVYELGTFADLRPFFTMKLVKGRTLSDLLRARPSPGDDLPRFLSIFESVCQTMSYAHVRGVIHRDLKPSNIMVGNFGEVQVMDWGLAKVLSQGGVADDEVSRRAEPQPVVSVIRTARSGSDADASQPGSVMGTPGYMAPEQARGEIDLVDERSDVFGLGAILCEILTGQPAFTGRTSEETLRKAVRGDVAEAFARLDGCGAERELIELARHCLAAEQDDRPRQAGAVSARINAYLTGVQERLRKAELARVEERARRRLTMAVAASVLGLFVLGGGGWAWLARQRQYRAEQFELAYHETQALNRQAERAGDDLSRWIAAGDAARAAQRLLPDAPDDATRSSGASFLTTVITACDMARRDQELLSKLVDVRSAQDNDLDGSTTDAAYAEAFREAGIDVEALAPEEAGAKIRARPGPVALALAAFLDDWADKRRLRRADPAGAGRLSAAARVADPDPRRNELRQALEQPRGADRTAGLRRLAQRAKFDDWPAVNLDLLGRALNYAGDAGAAETVLRQGQRRHPGDVWLNYGLAVCLEKLARRDEAIRYYTAARAIRPETAHRLAHALEAKGETDEAIAVFEDLARLWPTNGRHLACWGNCLMARGRVKEGAAVLDKAVAACREAIRLKPDDALAHANLGLVLGAQGKPAEAIAAYREAIRLKPDFAEAHRNLGLALQIQGKLAEAVAESSEAIRLEPDYAEAHNSLGAALKGQGKLAEAIAECREAIRLKPDSAEAHNNLGNALQEEGKLAEAIAESREAIRLKPDFAGAHINLGNALHQEGKLAQAIAAYREAIRLKPDDAEAHNNLGAALDGQGKPAEAIAACREAIRLKPDSAEAHINLGAALNGQGKLAEAIAAFREAIRLKPDSAEAHNNLGAALNGQGKLAAAIAECREAIRLQPDDAEAHYNLGRALTNQGKLAEAVAAYRDAIRHKSDYAEAHCNLGLLLQEQGKFREALAELGQGHVLGSKRAGWPYPSERWVRGAERLVALANRLPAVLRGDDKPKDGAEGLEFAYVAYRTNQFGPSARLFFDAIQVDPKLAEDTKTTNRYDAACAAALAAAGKGIDKPPLDEKAKTRWRNQALAWLKADLAYWTKQAETGTPAAKALVNQTLQHWKADTDLAGIRDEDALKTLAEEDRKTCRTLWVEVDRILKHVQP